MKMKIVAAVAALTIGATALATTQAQAKHPHGGWVFGGFVAGTIIGATIANDGPYYSCRMVRQYDQWGNYIGRAKVCNY